MTHQITDSKTPSPFPGYLTISQLSPRAKTLRFHELNPPRNLRESLLHPTKTTRPTKPTRFQTEPPPNNKSHQEIPHTNSLAKKAMDLPPQGRGRAHGRPRQAFNTPRGRARGPSPSHARGPIFNTCTALHTSPAQPMRPRFESNGSVPPHRAIHHLTPVSVVLKAEQHTGHRVHGVVADVLTRGDHPRGVKVRLRDGRVGRVQGVVSAAEGERGEALVAGSGGGGGAGVGVGSARGAGLVGGRVERDMREQDEHLLDEETWQAGSSARLGLFAALEDAHRGVGGGKGRGEGNARGRGRALDTPYAESEAHGQTGVATCPVCAEFEGDEAAVAHHVEQHFAS